MKVQSRTIAFILTAILLATTLMPKQAYAYGGLRGDIETSINTLETVIDESDLSRKETRRLNRTIAVLTAILDDQYWDDDFTPNLETGTAVFTGLRQAVGALSRLPKNFDAVHQVIGDSVSTAQNVAYAAMTPAESVILEAGCYETPGEPAAQNVQASDPATLAAVDCDAMNAQFRIALRKLERADESAASDKFTAAILTYSRAWSDFYAVVAMAAGG